NALIRLCRALEGARLESSRHFRNLAALQIRRELIDLARHHLGPQGHGARHHTDSGGKAADDPGGPLHANPGGRGGPGSPQAWLVFHEAVESLPEEAREVFGLLWYEGRTQEEAASLLGISLSTLKRRWQSARLLLSLALDGKRVG
ncbi:MAG TPA: sigma-70 family RNA polymerase sigma factor, partial [Gemmataceae bacterium]|nr:sigma-70 family RNA polymerase sigma factor [Gemmataceae bacterium]